MSLTYAILGVLEAHPMTGYELVRFFDDSMNWVWSAPQSQIYPRLRQMEKDGLVAGRKDVRGERLERRVYSITDDGLEALREWVRTPPEPASERDGLLLRAVFFDMIEPSQGVAVLERFIADQEALADDWTSHRDQLLAKSTPLLKERLRRRPPRQHDRIARLKAHVFDGKIAVARARIEWARAGIELLESRSQPANSPARRRAASPRASKSNAPGR